MRGTGVARLLPAAAALVAAVLSVGSLLSPAVGAQDGGGRVEVEVSAGFDGQIGTSQVLPVTVTMTSERARHVDVELRVEGSARRYRTELVAGAPVELDVALSPPPFEVTSFRIEATVTGTGGGRLGDAATEVVPRKDLTVVGVGPSLARSSDTSIERTVGGVQRAVLVPLTAERWREPGVLAALSGVVLGPADLDELTGEHHEQLRSWVWQGGNLALDVPRADDLPVVDLPAAEGARTAVGAGWVRFTDGAAAAGPWDRVLEPSVPTVTPDGFGDIWIGDDLDWLGLIDVRFLPTGAVIGAVFGTALLAGPALWFVLRTRARRRWMWLVSPALSLCVAGGLLVLGQGVFTRAEAKAAGDVVASPWTSSGQVIFGLKGSDDVRVPAEVEVIGASPRAVVSDAGDERAVRIELPRNGFGYLGLSPIPLDVGPRIEVTAVATGDDSADVTVTNHSESDLTDVSVRTGGRARPFGDVPAGASVTLPFLVNAEIRPIGQMYSSPEGGIAPDVIVGSGRSVRLPMARGLVVVTGTTEADVGAAGLRGRGSITVRAFAPVTAKGADPAALRVETVGVPPGGGTEEVVFGDEFATTTVVTEPVDEGSVSHVRVTSANGRPAGPCGVQSAVGELHAWDGSRWVPVEKVGERYESPRLATQKQVQGWDLPAIEPGGALYLRLTSRLMLPFAPLLFDCGGAA